MSIKLPEPDLAQLRDSARVLLGDASPFLPDDRLTDLIVEAWRDMIGKVPARAAQLFLWQRGWLELGDRLLPLAIPAEDKTPVEELPE